MELLSNVSRIVYKYKTPLVTAYWKAVRPYIYYKDGKHNTRREDVDDEIKNKGFTIIDTKVRPVGTTYVHLSDLLS